MLRTARERLTSVCYMVRLGLSPWASCDPFGVHLLALRRANTLFSLRFAQRGQPGGIADVGITYAYIGASQETLTRISCSNDFATCLPKQY